MLELRKHHPDDHVSLKVGKHVITGLLLGRSVSLFSYYESVDAKCKNHRQFNVWAYFSGNYTCLYNIFSATSVKDVISELFLIKK